MSLNKEIIGLVELDYSIYSGADLYSDGQIEDELLQIVQHVKCDEYIDVMREKNSWALYYHLSKERENIVSWYDFSENASILEIGAGCGAITGCFVEKKLDVTCVELSRKRSLINAYRNKDYPVKIIVGNFQEFANESQKKYDYISLIGVLEYAQSYISDVNNSYEVFLQEIYEHLNEHGKILIAIENRLGLKYWAGCKEDHTNRYFDSIEGYLNNKDVQTFTKKELKTLLEKVGFANIEFYYPYPDYKFPVMIYSEDYLPKQSDLNNNYINLDNDRLKLFDETAVFNTLIENDLFTEFSNSFFVVAERINE